MPDTCPKCLMRGKHVSCTLTELSHGNWVEKCENFTIAKMTSFISFSKITWQEGLSTSGSYLNKKHKRFLKIRWNRGLQDNRLLTRISVFTQSDHYSSYVNQTWFLKAFSLSVDIGSFFPEDWREFVEEEGGIHLVARSWGSVAKMLSIYKRVSWQEPSTKCSSDTPVSREHRISHDIRQFSWPSGFCPW